MPAWFIKAGIQGVISVLPRSQDVNYLFQRHISKGLILQEAYFEEKIKTAQEHINNYQQYNSHGANVPETLIELGTGWQPIVPIALSILGVPKIYSIDISELTKAHLIDETIAMFIVYLENGRLQKFLNYSESGILDRLKSAQSKIRENDILSAMAMLNIVPIVADARDLNFLDEQIEFFVSNSTLEHIPEMILSDIFDEFWRVASENAIASHLIDLSDHYSHFDNNLTPYNFLKYSDSTWKWFNNALHYQNRLRVSDYRKLHAETGFEIVTESNVSHLDKMLPANQLSSQFKQYESGDLSVTRSFIVSKVNKHS